MKKTIIILACALFAPLAFAQASSKGTREGTTTAETITVTGTIITATTDEGTASYQPLKTSVVREDASNNPGPYLLNGTGRVVSKAGEVVPTTIKPVYYIDTGHSRLVDHVVVEE